MNLKDIEFWSRDRRYGLKIPKTRINEIYSYCTELGGLETGGIIIGHYNAKRDCAVVTILTSAPSDSKAGTNWFYRGVDGLQNLLNRLWVNRRGYYLGEWHYHPACQPNPSGIDKKQIQEISRKKHYSCPEPILLIVSKSKYSEKTTKAYVLSREQTLKELFEHNQ